MTDGLDFRLHDSEISDFWQLEMPTNPKGGNILDGQVSKEETIRQTDAMGVDIDFTPFRDGGPVTSGLGLIYCIEDATNRPCGVAIEPDGYPLGEDIPGR